MDLRLSDEQTQLVDTFAALYAKESPPERVRAAEDAGFDRRLWDRLVDTGAITMAVSEDGGGWGATLLDLALVAEQSGRALASVPLVEAQVAARLLERVHAERDGERASTGTGDRLVTFAVRPAQPGRATMVPGASAADEAIVLAGDDLLLAALDPRPRRVGNLGSQALADIDLEAARVRVLARGPLAHEQFGRAVDEWLALTAAQLAGAGARALEIAVDYVKGRRAWGQPVGSFQSVAHTLADAATAVDGARLLSYEAAWAAAPGTDSRPRPDPEATSRTAELAAMAFAFAYQTARDVTYHALHFHGGYGFSMEYDVQLYYRRCRAWGLMWGDPHLAVQRVADARYGPVSTVDGAG